MDVSRLSGHMGSDAVFGRAVFGVRPQSPESA